MPSYTSSLRLIQPTTGEYPGTWGTQVNTGITALVDNAVAGTATIAVGSTDYTLSIVNGAADESRAAVLSLTAGAGVGARNIICPAVSKLYVVVNTSGFTQTVKTTAGTGVAVPTGTTAFVRCNGTDVVTALNYFGSLTLGAALPTSSGGTGSTSTTYCSLTANVTGTLPVANGGTGVTSSTGTGSVVLSTSPTLVTPLLGTPTSGTLTNCTGLPISTGVSGLGSGVATFLATPTSANLAAAVTGETGSGALVFATSPTLVTPALGTPSSGTLTSCTGLPISTGVSGLGTGVTTALAVNTGSSGAFVVNGGVLGTPSSGTATNLTGLPLTTGVTGTLPVANGGTGVTTSTGSGNNVLSTSPTLVTPILGTPTSGTLTNCTGLPLNTGTSGVLSAANGGTGVTSSTGTGSVVLSNSPVFITPQLGTPASGNLSACTSYLASNLSGLGANVATFLGTPTSANLAAAVTDETGSGALVFATSPTLVTPLLGTPTSGNLTNCTGLPLNTGVTNVLSLSNGGTGQTNQAAAITALAGSVTSGNYLRGNGTVVTMSAIQAGDITTLNDGTSLSVSGTVNASTVGFRGVPQNSQTGAYQLVLADAGKHISITTGGVTIPANGSVAFPIGTAVSIYNDSTSNQNISITTDTLRVAGTATTGTRTLAQYGLVTVLKVASTVWVISGSGLS